MAENTNDANENDVDYIITREGLNNDNAVHSRNDRLSHDVTTSNDVTEEALNDEPDWPNEAGLPKAHETHSPNTANDLQKDEIISERPKNKEIFPHENLRTETDKQNSPKRGDDIIVPEISENDVRNESLSPRGGKYNLRPNPNPNYSEDYRY